MSEIDPSIIEEGESQDAKAVRIIHDHIAVLRVHFASVRIFCTREAGSITKNYSSGSGNYYAQSGQIREWLMMEDEVIRQHAEGDSDEV